MFGTRRVLYGRVASRVSHPRCTVYGRFNTRCALLLAAIPTVLGRPIIAAVSRLQRNPARRRAGGTFYAVARRRAYNLTASYVLINFQTAAAADRAWACIVIMRVPADALSPARDRSRNLRRRSPFRSISERTRRSFRRDRRHSRSLFAYGIYTVIIVTPPHCSTNCILLCYCSGTLWLCPRQPLC